VVANLLGEPDKLESLPVTASVWIFDADLPASRYNAATPATCGDAIEVPAFVEVPPVVDSDTIPTPGANISTQLPQFEKTVRPFEPFIAPTASAPAAEDGEKLQASAFAFPAATTTTIPRLAAELMALSRAEFVPPERLILMTIFLLVFSLLILDI
jgi:hypothetical protein